jgi:biotin carboxyl carrier protein
MDKVMSLPRAKEFLNWKPEGYDKSVDEFRQEMGPELSDDDLLLKILIPGKPVKRTEPKKTGAIPVPPVVKTPTPVTLPTDFPNEFTVDIDGEVFNVKISPVWDGTGKTETTMHEAETSQIQKTIGRPKDIPSGAVLCGMAGLILSIEAKVGDRVKSGDLLAMVEAMKMRRHVNSPYGGVVKEIFAQEGEMVNPEDILMVVE